jgi:hypothetical protein
MINYPFWFTNKFIIRLHSTICGLPRPIAHIQEGFSWKAANYRRIKRQFDFCEQM